MDPSNFSSITAWTLAHGYSLMFLLMLVEGPAVTAAGAFGAALGHFNLLLVYALAVLGNVVPDAAYYALGYFGRKKLIDRWGHYFGFTPERKAHLDTLVHGHAGKAIATIKLVPFLASPGLITIGATHMPIKKYAKWSLSMNVSASFVYLIIGYYFGTAYDKIEQYINLGSYAVLIALAVAVAVYFIHRHLGRHVAKQITKK